MESKRQQKINKLIQKELSEVFQRESAHMVSGTLITITIVRVSSDLGLAKVYISVMPESKAQAVLDNIANEISVVRHALGNRMRNQLRKIPELRFYEDDTAQYASKMNQIFNSLDIPEAPEEDTEDED